MVPPFIGRSLPTVASDVDFVEACPGNRDLAVRLEE
jgi:hypothetical protein